MYEKLIYKVGSLYSLLRELQETNQFQGEMSILYNRDGIETTIYVYIDGTDFQITDTPGGSSGMSFSTSVTSG